MCDNESEDIRILISYINETIREKRNDNVNLNTVSSLWIILFGLIIVQKLFKYVLKPIARTRTRARNNESVETNNVQTSSTSDNGSQSAEDAVVDGSTNLPTLVDCSVM